jgi:hypothetical protein
MAKDVQRENLSKQVYRGFDNRLIFQLNALAKARAEFVQRENVASDPVATFDLLDSAYATAGLRRISLPNSANSNGFGIARSWQTYSSRRFKERILDIKNAIDTILKLRPVSFMWKAEYGGNPDHGFIAEEIADVIYEAAGYDSDGMPDSVDSTKLVPFLVSAMQEQQREIESLKADIASIKASLNNSPI